MYQYGEFSPHYRWHQYPDRLVDLIDPGVHGFRFAIDTQEEVRGSLGTVHGRGVSCAHSIINLADIAQASQQWASLASGSSIAIITPRKAKTGATASNQQSLISKPDLLLPPVASRISSPFFVASSPISCARSLTWHPIPIPSNQKKDRQSLVAYAMS